MFGLRHFPFIVGIRHSNVDRKYVIRNILRPPRPDSLHSGHDGESREASPVPPSVSHGRTLQKCDSPGHTGAGLRPIACSARIAFASAHTKCTAQPTVG